ncbi:MAG TPA: hypothetical protein VLL54_20885 [Pyrinomonadaceae bacterium]|nr:hypothetical protein [Pyrinomonadaceae bacterium]
MKRFFAIAFFVLFVFSVPVVHGQQDDPDARERTRTKIAALLESFGPSVHIDFRQSDKQPFNYVGALRTGLANTDFFEIVISVTKKDTIGFRIYPHFNKGYINVDKVKDRQGFMRLLLRLSDRAFLFWGADESGDVFTGYTFTLESGFPDEAIKIVLRSIVNSDKFIGELRPFIDGSAAAAEK